jgi:hypothetical protein
MIFSLYEEIIFIFSVINKFLAILKGVFFQLNLFKLFLA